MKTKYVMAQRKDASGNVEKVKIDDGTIISKEQVISELLRGQRFIAKYPNGDEKLVVTNGEKIWVEDIMGVGS